MRALASRRVNTDPKPYYVAELADSAHDGRVAESSVDFSSTEYDGEGGTLYHLAKLRPRPEFANNPNPILEAFRAYCAARTVSLAACARVELVWLSRGMATGQREATLEHEAHARKVLTRISTMEDGHAE